MPGSSHLCPQTLRVLTCALRTNNMPDPAHHMWPCSVGKGSAPQFDLATALTRKETRTIRKAEGMIQYNLARCPNYGVFESPEYARAEELKAKIKSIEAKAHKRWEANF